MAYDVLQLLVELRARGGGAGYGSVQECTKSCSSYGYSNAPSGSPTDGIRRRILGTTSKRKNPWVDESAAAVDVVFPVS